MMSNLLATKLRCPSAPLKRVQRPRLIQRLNEGLAAGHHLTLISAPAGFGKTTCVSEWVNGLDSISVSWLSLDSADDDPVRFFTYFIAALQRIDESLGQDIEKILRSGQFPTGEVISTVLINGLMRVQHPFILILDDFHVIQEHTILQFLEHLVSNMPPSLHLALITREDPSLPLARLRANNQMTEIRVGELRFTNLEVEQFLNEIMGLCISQPDIAILEDRTEGWIVGLQLASLSIRDRENPSGFIAGLSGSHRYILTYLTEEVLNRQPKDIQLFLLQTSILEKLCGELCDSVTECTDSGALLEQLLTANLFLVPLDDEQKWYRYHHLFADLLANQLRQTLPADTIQELHSRAGEWLAKNELFDEAIAHAMASKDYERVCSLIEQVTRPMMYSGRVNILANWLAALPEEFFNTHPKMVIYRFWIDVLQNKTDFSEAAMQEKEIMLRDLPPSPENDQLRLDLKVLFCRFVALTGNTTKAIQMAQEVLSSAPESDLASRARAYSALTVAHGLEGNLEKANQAFQECIHMALTAGYYSLAAHTTMLAAQAQYPYGQLHEAVRLYQTITDMGEQVGQEIFFPAGQGYIGLASIYLEWYDLETAEAYLQQGMELCRQGGLDGVFLGYSIKSRLCQARGDFNGALENLLPLEQVSHKWGDAALPTRQIQIRLALGDVGSVSRWAGPLMALLGGGPAIPRVPLLVKEAISAVIIRIYIAQGEIEKALQLLDELQTTAEAGGRLGRLLETYLLRTLVFQKQNKGNVTPESLELFEQALNLAEPEGFFLIFLEEGQAVVPLLNATINHPAAPSRIKDYARKLLAALSGDSKPAISSTEDTAATDEMIEPLSKREIEILQLIGEGCSNQEIAERLVVTLHTVKKHSSNIFTKLGVNSRTQAVARARQLGLL